MKVSDIIQEGAKRRGFPTYLKLHQALEAAGWDISETAVYYWWTGTNRPQRHGKQLAEFLGLADAERMGLYEGELADPPVSSKSGEAA